MANYIYYTESFSKGTLFDKAFWKGDVSENMQEIKEVFREMGVDLTRLFFGRGCNRRKKTGNSRDRYYISTSALLPNAKYIIQFCKDIHQYIVWRCVDIPRRTIFSVIADNVPIVGNTSIKSTQKGIEFAWQEKEDVYTFNKSGIRNFAKTILLHEQEK